MLHWKLVGSSGKCLCGFSWLKLGTNVGLKIWFPGIKLLQPPWISRVKPWTKCCRFGDILKSAAPWEKFGALFQGSKPLEQTGGFGQLTHSLQKRGGKLPPFCETSGTNRLAFGTHKILYPKFSPLGGFTAGTFCCDKWLFSWNNRGKNFPGNVALPGGHLPQKGAQGRYISDNSLDRGV